MATNPPEAESLAYWVGRLRELRRQERQAKATIEGATLILKAAKGGLEVAEARLKGLGADLALHEAVGEYRTEEAEG